MQSRTAPPSEKLRGEVERLAYSADETGYAVCRLRVPGELDLVGRWLNHPKFGLQFQAARLSSARFSKSRRITFSTSDTEEQK